MGSLTHLFGAAGLAGASGHRAFIPALLLGVMHHLTDYQLNEHFAWLAEPWVMVTLGVLTVVEILAEMNPDVPELVNLSLKLPKLLAGFVVVAAEVGQMTDSMTAMVASGVLGAGTALTIDTLRADVKHTVDGALSAPSDGLSTKVMGGAESAWAAVLAVLSIVLPILAAVGVLLLVGIWFGARRAARAKYVPCPACGEARHPEASACPHCRAAIA